MDEKENLKSIIQSAKFAIPPRYLEKKAKNHRLYSSYTDYKYINPAATFSLFFGMSSNWIDEWDKKRCARDNKNGQNTIKAKFVYKKLVGKNNVSESFDLNPDWLRCFDIIYLSNNSDKDEWLVCKGTDSVSGCSHESINEIKRLICWKRYVFAPEVETRFQFKISRKDFKSFQAKVGGNETIGISIDFSEQCINSDSFLYRIRPNFICKRTNADNETKILNLTSYPKKAFIGGPEIKSSELGANEEGDGT